jgi:hypothetical protein
VTERKLKGATDMKRQIRFPSLLITAAVVISGLSISAATVVMTEEPAAAATYQVAFTGGDGVAFRWSANVNDKKQPIHGAPEGAAIEVLCQTWSPTVAGPRANHIFDFILYRGERAFVPDAYVNTPAPANQFSPGLARCQPGSSDIRNGDIVGVATNDAHGWGPCTVQDFNQSVPGTPWGWYIRAGRGNLNQTVRNGMLWGWFDNGGAGGSLGCPVNDEYGYKGGSRQDFNGGWLLWCPGFDHSRRFGPGVGDGCNVGNPTADAAISWARRKLNQNYDSGYCLRFVWEAYRAAGKDVGTSYSAVTYWNARPGMQHRDMNIPRGALVFWGPNPGNPDGHVVLAEGGDLGISTAERQFTLVHEMSISDRNRTRPYLGWIMP